MLIMGNGEQVQLERSYMNGFTATIGYAANAKSLSLQINKIQVQKESNTCMYYIQGI